MRILIDEDVFTVVKYYSDYIWRLVSDNGEIVNIFYSLETKYTILNN